MMANRMKSAFLAAALVSALAPCALAGDFRAEQRHPRSAYLNSDRLPHGHHHDGRSQLKWISAKTLGGASRAAGSAGIRPDKGSVTPVGSAGTGIVIGSTLYFDDGSRVAYLDRLDAAPRRSRLSYPAPRARIIEVTEELPDGSIRTLDGCSYEMGVCVIRGGR